jgi:hypothetical protein
MEAQPEYESWRLVTGEMTITRHGRKVIFLGTNDRRLAEKVVKELNKPTKPKENLNGYPSRTD